MFRDVVEVAGGRTDFVSPLLPKFPDGCSVFAVAAQMGRKGGRGSSIASVTGQDPGVLGMKAFEKFRFRPMYAGATMGHPFREEGFVV
jgi:hypothetical protein